MIRHAGPAHLAHLRELADRAIAAEGAYLHELRLNSARAIHRADDERHQVAARLLAALENQPTLLRRRGWGLHVHWSPEEGRAKVACDRIRDLDPSGPAAPEELAGLIGRVLADLIGQLIAEVARPRGP